MENSNFTASRNSQTVIGGNKITILKGDEVKVNYKTKPFFVLGNQTHSELVGAEILLNGKSIVDFNENQIQELDDFLTIFKA